jgi:hypothetical protein
MRSTLLAIDPSLAAPGYAVLELGLTGPFLLAAGVFETKRADENKRRSVFDDNMRRALYIRRELRAVIDRYTPQLIAVEAAGGSKSAQAVGAMMIAQAVVACLVDEHLRGGRPIYITALEASTALGVQPTQRAKKGEKKSSAQSSRDRKARKAAVAQAVVERLGVRQWFCALDIREEPIAYDDVIDPRWDGAHDAAAIALAAWELPEVAAFRMIARQATIDEPVA